MASSPLIRTHDTDPDRGQAKPATGDGADGNGSVAERRGHGVRAGILLGRSHFACSALRHGLRTYRHACSAGNAPTQGQQGIRQGLPRAAWWRTNRGPQWRPRECCRQVAPQPMRRWRSASPWPSRCRPAAGLGGGGACLAYAADKKSVNAGVPEAMLFTPIAPASVGANADRPAAVPMLARGLYSAARPLRAQPFESLVVPAEQFARLRHPARARWSATSRWWPARCSPIRTRARCSPRTARR